MHALRWIILVFWLVWAAGCDGSDPETEEIPLGPGVVYSNSFETAADTAGWPVNGVFEVRDEAPDGGGQRSVLVSGGCIHPHSAYTFSAPDDGAFVVRAWGKNLEIGGGVGLRSGATGEQVGVQVTEKGWAQVQSEAQIVASEGDPLQISMSAGGFVSSAMLVTQVEVARVD